MVDNMHSDANQIIKQVIQDNLPNVSVQNALSNHAFSENVYVVAIGKAAWTMAKTSHDFLVGKIKSGIVITKYDHSQGSIPNFEVIEAGHPLSDNNTMIGTQKVIDLVANLGADDEVLFLVSGGGSALFERPLEGITLDEIVDINNQLLASGADIIEINMIRKRLSAVKAGRFAQICAPAKIFAVILSDVLGDKLDSIASGPAVPDKTTAEDAENVVAKYNLNLSNLALSYLKEETPKSVDNVKIAITGSVRTLCESAKTAAANLGYTPYLLTSTLDCQAREAGRFLASIAQSTKSGENSFKVPCAIILGGETVVTLKGTGRGGRNQELALSAGLGIAGLDNTVVFSLGSDGTDGPTDAAGGIVDGYTVAKLNEKGINAFKYLENNDSYNALKEVGGLIMTGPTGTNVNDVTIVLCK